MIGTIVNCIAIILGCIFGLLLKGKISEKISSTVMSGLALCIIYIGISGALKGTDMILILISITLGALIGEIIDIDNWLNRCGNFIEKKVKNKNNEVSIAEGFISASLLFCVGAMAIVGSLESGLKGEHGTLLAKSILDGVSSIIFTSTLGIGVIFSSIAVFVYQGSITLGASLISGFLSDTIITNMTAIGSLLIIAIGLNMLRVTKIKVANILPSIFIYLILATVKVYFKL